MAFEESMAFRDCPWCGLRHAQMVVLSRNQQAPRTSGPSRWYALVSCPECGGPVVVEHTPQNSSPHRIEAVFPESTDDVSVEGLPADVEDYYRDAVKVLRAGVPDAAVVQLRRTLEAACAHYNVSERSLVKSIEKLIDDGHVTKSFGKVLHHVRQVGNAGAHHTDSRVDEGDAARALRFTTQLLRNLFEVPAELASLEAEAPGPEGDTA